ncbi:uncharacterized protein LOC6051048 [Culex quinquefasciatus]|uniref:uncharacterized protein LOC6051048 n=1 Tax=Culex quinquefasciatus TaxID=7176 RepID=UPI0018E3DA26|nr:uncharacterized protein LOC6051048 [Culex quinquefasciatus]
MSSENYSIAWDLLQKKYEHKKLIVKAHLDALVALEPMKKESYNALNHLISEFDRNLQMLDKIGENTAQWSTVLVHMVCSRLDPATIRHWENHHKSKEVPKYTDLVEFLRSQCSILQAVKSNNPEVKKQKFTTGHAFVQAKQQHQQQQRRCPFCKEYPHSAFRCQKLQQMTVQERYEAVKRNGLCLNCLSPLHLIRNCTSGSCRHCRPSPSNAIALSTTTEQPYRQVLLSTAVVRLTDRYGNTQYARALLDSCSEYCFITTNLAQKLKLVEAASCLSVAGIGGSVVQSTKVVEATVFPRSLRISPYSENIQLHVLPKLTSRLPTEKINVQQLNIPDDLMLADPEFYKPGPIDIILGAEFYYDLLADGRLKLSDEGPTLQHTVLGWVVSGRIPSSYSNIPKMLAYSCHNVDLRELVSRFWELESCNTRSAHSVEESMCEEIFAKTTVRDAEGRFVVQLPKKDYVMERLGDSKDIALKRLEGMERRFAVNSTLKTLYTEFIQEYLAMGHMVEVPEDDTAQRTYFLPHHAVLRPESTTTKLRVVFDASCRTITGVSLNDGLMVGPVVQDDLLPIILRFRCWKYALVADVAKMYRMVPMDEADQPLQRIWWRDNPSDPAKAYQLTTVTYGTASAPYLATKCLQQLSVIGQESHPLAAKVVGRDFYVDDLLSGAATIDNGIALVEELVDLLDTVGFTLRKWTSNSSEILETIPPELRDERNILELDSSSSFVKTLGLIWEPSTDSFRFKAPKWKSESPITKKVVLSDTASIFDPVGLIGPVVVQAKIFIQKLWQEKYGWDQTLAEDHRNYWLEYRRNLMALDTLRIPRWIGLGGCLASVQFHGFCDASQQAYGACLYLRAVQVDGLITLHLITSKSRVAPLEDLARKKKKRDITLLELSAALLLCHLYDLVRRSIQQEIQAFFWTDSMIVLCWLASLPSRWKPFVANRVSEIQHVTVDGVWSHIAGVDNPADIISRGCTPAELLYKPEWYGRLQYLLLEQEQWPKLGNRAPESELALKEERSTVSLPARARPPNELFSLRSNYHELIRLVAWVRRFAHNARHTNRDCRRTGELSHVELREALTFLIRVAQTEGFPEEIADLTKKKPIQPSSKLLALNPRLIDGVMRVGGRLMNAPVPESRKHPIILHHQHPFTKIVMSYYHWMLYHAGQQLLIAAVRGKYWPTNIRSLARQTIHRCVDCFKAKPRVHEQLMADLPSVRVCPAAAFQKVGVDFCGPFYIRYPIRRSVPVKCFVAIFVCLVTKAVHMEVVADLSTQAFLAAFKRFVAIRGKSQLVMCDNATNFVGANRELQKLLQQLLDQLAQHTIVRTAEEDGIEFKFIPPRSPNFGGLWEAAVKSFKAHFRKTIGSRTLTYDELHTVVQQIAAILNSRPLTPLSNDPDDFDALTPGHFLTGRPLAAVPEPDLQEIPENRLALWQRTQAFVQQIWRKWKTEYLSNLQN